MPMAMGGGGVVYRMTTNCIVNSENIIIKVNNCTKVTVMMKENTHYLPPTSMALYDSRVWSRGWDELEMIL